MKIKDCRRWPCNGEFDAEHIWTKREIREVHGLHQVEATYVGQNWDHMVVGISGIPWKPLIHKGKKP